MDAPPGSRLDDQLRFHGNWHDAYPRALSHDPRLGAMEVRVWLILRAQVQPHTARPFPDYDEIMQAANLGSRSTLSKSLKILRATRWLFVQTRRDATSGQIIGNAYVLRDTPASFVEACDADPGYIHLLKSLASDGQPQLQAVGRHELQQIDLAAEAGIDPMTLGATSPATGGVSVDSKPFDPPTIGYDDLPHAPEPESGTDPARKPPEMHESNNRTRAQSPETGLGPVQLLDSSLCSSSYLNKTTTTKTSANETSATSPDELAFPDSFSANERHIAARYLNAVAEADRQIILDELDYKIRHGASTGQPVRNPLGYLNWYCNQARSGQLAISSASLHRVREREQQRRQDAKIRELTRRGEQQTIAPGSVAEKSLKLRTRSRNKRRNTRQ